MIYQILQVLGAGLVLLGFWLNHRGAVAADSRVYNLINLAGAGVLTAISFVGGQWGFFALNAVWSCIAAAGLVRARGPKRADPIRECRACGESLLCPVCEADESQGIHALAEIAALRNCLLLAVRMRRRHNSGPWDEVIRFCEAAGVRPEILRSADDPARAAAPSAPGGGELEAQVEAHVRRLGKARASDITALGWRGKEGAMPDDYAGAAERLRERGVLAVGPDFWYRPADYPPGPPYTLCEDTALLAVSGACPVHGGDNCLRQFAAVRDGDERTLADGALGLMFEFALQEIEAIRERSARYGGRIGDGWAETASDAVRLSGRLRDLQRLMGAEPGR